MGVVACAVGTVNVILDIAVSPKGAVGRLICQDRGGYSCGRWQTICLLTGVSVPDKLSEVKVSLGTLQTFRFANRLRIRGYQQRRQVALALRGGWGLKHHLITLATTVNLNACLVGLQPRACLSYHRGPVCLPPRACLRNTHWQPATLPLATRWQQNALAHWLQQQGRLWAVLAVISSQVGGVATRSRASLG